LLSRQFIVGARQQLTGRRIDHIMSDHFANQIIAWHFQMLHISLGQLTNVARCDTATFGHQDLAIDLDIERSQVTAQAFRHQLQSNLVLRKAEDIMFEKHLQHLLWLIAQRA